MLRRARGCLPASGETRSMHSSGVIVAGVLCSLLSVVGFTCSQITYPYGYLPYVWYFTILGQLPQKNAPGPQTWLSVGEQATTKEVEIWDQSPTKDRRVGGCAHSDQSPTNAVDKEVREPSAEPTKQDQQAPIRMVSGRAWSPGIYQALRLLGKSLDVAWERVFIHPLTFN